MHAFFEQRSRHFQAVSPTALSFPPHLHPQLELYLVLSGESMITVRDRTGHLQAGSLALIFPNQIHSYTALSPDTQALLVICDLSYAGRYADTLLLHVPQEPFLVPDALHPNVGFALRELVAEAQSREDSPVFAPLVQLILARTLPTLALQRCRSTDHQELTYQIASCIGEHFREPLTLTGLSQALGVSKYHLSHIFSEKIGQNFPSYLSQVRLSFACGLLTETGRSVTEIAEEAGFESQRTFFRVFREQFGVTPLQYRRRAQKP